MRLALALCLWLLASPAAAQTIGGDFALRDSAGHQVSAHNYAGKYFLVFFGYTNCPDVCPVTLYNIARALVLLGPQADRVVPLFITVDPARDTPALMGRYTALFSPRIIGLTGSVEQIAAVERTYHVYAAPTPKNDLILHSAILFLMGPDGVFVSGLPADTPPAALAAALRAAMDKPS
jgi:protein SCO1/2